VEYQTFLDWSLQYWEPAPPQAFLDWVTAQPNLLYNFADMLMYTLPSPRYKWYENPNYQKLQDAILTETNTAIEQLGFYDVRSFTGLLDTMKLTSAATLLIGILFGIIVALFVAISTLLIYSLLMITVEKKTFENGVLRMLGLSRTDCVQMILIQSFLFVFPSITFAYISAIPTLSAIHSAMFKQENISISPLPAVSATVDGVLLGLLIPTLGSLIPIQVAMAK
jgi:ABC-type antimicrobial peptide transport system permease subunit